MILDLEQALDEPVDLSHRFDVPVERLERPEVVALQPVEFTGRLQRIDPGFVLSGRLGLVATLSCARCLTELPFRASEEIAWTFTPAHRAVRGTGSHPAHAGRPPEGPRAKDRRKDAGKGRGHAQDAEEELELSPADLDTVVYEDFQVPFDPLIEEQIQLALPMKPLCRETCQGLCPTCGQDLNKGTCGCRPPEDDRWSTLRELAPPPAKNRS